MPIYDFKCPDCGRVKEDVVILRKSDTTMMCGGKRVEVELWCWNCNQRMERLISAPASIKMADMEKINRRRQRIKEPMWRDLETNKLTPVNP